MFRLRIALAVLATFLLQTHAAAAVAIAGTRVIYAASEREATIKLSNRGRQPALVQAWIDDGREEDGFSDAEVPFTLTPPMARIEAGRAQTLLIFHTGEALPQDRESLYWLNVLDIPPEAGAAESGRNRLEIAIRSRIKLIYRPAGLTGSAARAPAQLVWKIVQEGERSVLEINNPTPFYVAFGTLSLSQCANGKDVSLDAVDAVAPKAMRRHELGPAAACSGANVVARYLAINDYGASVPGDAPVPVISGATP